MNRIRRIILGSGGGAASGRRSGTGSLGWVVQASAGDIGQIKQVTCKAGDGDATEVRIDDVGEGDAFLASTRNVGEG